MGTMVERIRAICKENGVAVSRLESDLGFGNGYLNPKKIQSITTARALKIADYLNIGVDELIGIETKNHPAENEVSEDDIKFALAGEAGKHLTDDDMEKVRAFAAFTAQERMRNDGR